MRAIFPPVYLPNKNWAAGDNTTVNSIVEDSLGDRRTIAVRYFRNGFKRWGDVDTKKIKMFIIGDSFTLMRLVSNGEEWYSYLEQEFGDLELFVYGGGGYGSLQEFMILDEFIDKIHPQLILIQFCGNDYANNLYDLDLRGYPYNNHAVRPYLEDGKIVYRLPLPFAALRKRSFIADRVLVVYDRFVSHQATKNLDAYQEKKRREWL